MSVIVGFEIEYRGLGVACSKHRATDHQQHKTIGDGTISMAGGCGGCVSTTTCAWGQKVVPHCDASQLSRADPSLIEEDHRDLLRLKSALAVPS